ncbi:MAG: SxtJ family membrane protein [Pyrinomonadaceae bacterium]
MTNPSARSTTPRKKRASHHTDVTDAQARKTAFVVAVVLTLIAAWNLYRGRMVVVGVLGGLGILLVFAGLFVPVAARTFHRFWMGFAGVLGYVNSRILLTVLYYGLFTPYGLISRAVGRDPLLRRGANRESYWIKRENTRQTKDQFERLF